MTTNILERDKVINYDTDMWVDEAIWGHRLYDEQTPWLTFLEFLGILQTELEQDKALAEPNSLKYNSYSRLYLRNILFNNPQLEAIYTEYDHDDDRWEQWLKIIAEKSGGIESADFSYLEKRFTSFRDFVEVVKFLQSTAIEGDSNKRWSSKFVFPYGPDCLYEDLRVTDKGGANNDRRFFARTGELLYLMLCRSEKGAEILPHLQKIGIVSPKNFPTNKWNQLVAMLQPENHRQYREKSSSSKPPYLPYIKLPEYENLANDWLNLFNCNLPNYDVLPHLVTITGLHLLLYLLHRAKAILNEPIPPTFVLEIVASKKTLVRDLASDSYSENNGLSVKAIQAKIHSIGESAEWQKCQNISEAISILQTEFFWTEDKSSGTPQTILEEFCQKAIAGHKQHLGKFHSNWAKEIGLSSSKGSRRIRYTPTDFLLKTLVLCSVPKRLEFQEFLTILYEKYGFIIGEQQAQKFIVTGEADKTTFFENKQRLENRLTSLGLVKRLSDACAYVQNPFYREIN